MIGDDEKRFFFIALIEHLDNLCAAELIDNGIQCDGPSKQSTCDAKHDDISEENVIPCVNSFLLSQIDADKIRATGGGAHIKAQADGKSVYESAEDTNQEDILREDIAWQNIDKNTGQKNCQDRINRKFLPNIFKTDINRKKIQDNVKECVRDFHMGKFDSDFLQ